MFQSTAPVVLVTGAAQGIGKGIVRHLLVLGYRVYMVDNNQAASDQTFEVYQQLAEPDQLHQLAVDVSREDDVKACFDTIARQTGRLDALINNAGLASHDSGPIEQLTLENWQKIIDTNLTGAFLMTRYAVPLLRKPKGTIVNIASTRALQSEPDSEAYAATKGGLVALTHALAVSLGPDIRVNCISPGWIDVRGLQFQASTPEPLSDEDHQQHPVGRVGEPDDIANLVAFLISKEAGFITGQNIVADGGMTRKMIYR